MSKDSIAVGLDIGTTKIVAMIGRKNEFGKLEILGLGKAKSLGVSRGVVNNITQTINSIQQAIGAAEEASGLQIEDVVVGIAGQHIRSIQYTDYIIRPDFEEVISEQDIDNLVGQVQKLAMLPGEEIIHILPQEYLVDGTSESKEPIGMAGSRLEANFHVVVGQASSIRNVGKCIKGANLDLADLTLEPLASADAVLSYDEKDAGVALVDIGGGTTDLAIFKGGIIRHTAVIPYGGNAITDDIKEGCSIIEKQAEALKIKFGSAWPEDNKENEIVSIPSFRGQEPKEISLKNLSLIINARVLEIIEIVFDEIKSYGYDEQRKKLIAGIVLTGGGAQLKHIKQLVEYVSGLDTRIGYPNEHLAGNSQKDISSPMYATAVGLVMKGLEHKSYSAVSAHRIDRSEKEAAAEAQKVVIKSEPVVEVAPVIETKAQEPTQQVEEKKNEKDNGPKRNFLDKFIEKFKEFIDNVE